MILLINNHYYILHFSYPTVPLLTDNISRIDDEEEGFDDDDTLEIDSDEELLIKDNDTPLLVLPLYSMLSPDKQYKVVNEWYHNVIMRNYYNYIKGVSSST